MLKEYELFISPIKEGSGIWENKELIFIGSVRVGERRLGCINKKDILPMVRNIDLGKYCYEVWAYRKPIYSFLLFLEGRENV